MAGHDGQGTIASETGNGGELHQRTDDRDHMLHTNQGVPISDDQNSLRSGHRGPTLLEDFVLREKITHFDHERIPERVVHARGYGAHGHFEPCADNSDLTSAHFLQGRGTRTPVFVRFSTVAGSKGSFDTARDVRGFATKFYTQQGNFDLVGNNIPVFFIQDAIKFPDLIHSVKPEPDRGFPQAQSAHDTFWDFISLMPESIHMALWIMSDRAIPRSFRMMEGFGVNTYKMVNAAGEVRLVKFHWRPKLGSFSLVWDEAVKIAGADPDFHRRDLWQAIENGDFPEYDLCVQVFDQAMADGFDFDVLDATKIVPEELVPLRKLGTMVLDRNVDSFFAETEQVAFCPSHMVPGIDFSDDPLLQGRVFSYLDTQLSRLGSPNFHEIPVNQPKCPWHNLQRGGHMRTTREHGRVSYEPNSLAPRESFREAATGGFVTDATADTGAKVRVRAESFADHYTQARQFYRSQTDVEQRHIAEAFAFELGKVETAAVRKRMLGHLDLVDAELGEAVASKLGMQGQADAIEPAVAPRDTEPSDALSIYKSAPESVAGKKFGVVVTDGASKALVDAVRSEAKSNGARVDIIAPKIGGATLDDGTTIEADEFVRGGPSVLYDAVALIVSDDGCQALLDEPAAVDFVRDAFAHGKAIGFTPAARPLLEAGRVDPGADDGLVELDDGTAATLVKRAARWRYWARGA